MLSALGFIAMFLLLGYIFLNKRNIAIIPILFVSAIVLTSFIDLEPVQRIKDIMNAFWTYDVEQIQKADLSASARIIPWLLYSNFFDITSVDTWFGNGIDYSVSNLSRLFFGYDVDRRNAIIGASFFPCVAIDYGLIAFLLFILSFKEMCFKKIFSYDFFLWIVLFATTPLNTYLFWFSLLLLTVNKYFMMQKNKVL
jgi:hypothetical protein